MPVDVVPNRRRKLLFQAVLVLVVWIVVEALTLVTLHRLYQKDRGQHRLPPVGNGQFLLPTQTQVLQDTLAGKHQFLKFHPELGWEPEPGATTDKIHLNSLGARSTREYPEVPEPGRLRLAAFGDSFTFCHESTDEDCWSAQLEAMCNIDVLNFGVPGYAPDQALLRFRNKAPQFQADIVLLGIMNENIFRVMNQYRPALYRITSMPLTKPRFVLDANSALELRPNILRSTAEVAKLVAYDDALIGQIEAEEYYPLPPWRAHRLDRLPSARLLRLLDYRWDRWRQKQAVLDPPFYEASSPAFAVLVAIAETFAAEVEARGASPVIVLWPDSGALTVLREHGRTPYATLRETLASKGLTVWDLADAFHTYGSDQPIVSFFSGHYNRAGNKVAAKGILDALRQEHGVCRETQPSEDS